MTKFNGEVDLNQGIPWEGGEIPVHITKRKSRYLETNSK